MILRQKPITRSSLSRQSVPLKKKRKGARRVTADRIPEYRKWIREECKCVACVKIDDPSMPSFMRIPVVDPAHTQNNGMRSKGPDSSCAPLCRQHHREYDAGREAFEKRYEIDMKEEAQKVYAAFLIEREAKK